MDKLGMKTKDISKEKFEILKELFPNAVTETVSENKMGGGTVNQVSRTIDIDVLRQEINGNVVEGKEERYEFTWPEKKKAIIEANSPINKTLRPIREESVNFDTTENLYIEGDNLEALKLLRETYLGKIKMIYIDPPYNTGSDFIYNDDFSQSEEEYKEISGNYDEDGNRLFKNTDSNGRFHTDWLNMMYPRLKLARDLLTDDGVIFISIDDNEQANLKKVCDEIFGADNIVNQLVIKTSETKGLKNAHAHLKFPKQKEYILVYSKNKSFFSMNPLEIPKSDSELSKYLKYYNKKINNIYKDISEWKIENYLGNDKIKDSETLIYLVEPDNEVKLDIKDKEFKILKNSQGKELIYYCIDNKIKKVLFLKDNLTKKESDLWLDISTINLNKETNGIPNYSNGQKPLKLIEKILRTLNEDCIVMDFFSGSATVAQAIMEMNVKNNKNFKFIMIQIQESLEKNLKEATSKELKNGISKQIKFLQTINKPLNICEIGKERIRRASKKLKEENPNSNFDDGFRVLRIDSSNMEDVYYKPEEFTQENLKMFESNIKKDRSGEDLLFQVMLDLGIELSNKIEEKFIQNNKIYDVGENFLIACFDENITEEVVTEIAKLKPFFAIFKEGNNLTDNTLINFEEIFKTYSPDTKRRVL